MKSKNGTAISIVSRRLSGASRIAPVACACIILGTGCGRPSNPRPGFVPDLGEVLNDRKRAHRIEWEREEIGQTGFYVLVGAITYQDEADDSPDVYQTRVTFKEAEKRFRYCFTREIPIERLKEGSWSTDFKEVVSYDEATRTVTFQVGEERFDYVLPW